MKQSWKLIMLKMKLILQGKIKGTNLRRTFNMAKLDETLTMLKDLTDAKGIAGHEKEPREVIEKYISPYADEVYTDNLGSLIASKVGDSNGPKVMVAGQDRKSTRLNSSHVS